MIALSSKSAQITPQILETNKLCNGSCSPPKKKCLRQKTNTRKDEALIIMLAKSSMVSKIS